MTEKQTAWNSDNEGIKETFTQIGRRAAGAETGIRVERMQGKAGDCSGEAGLAERETKDSS